MSSPKGNSINDPTRIVLNSLFIVQRCCLASCCQIHHETYQITVFVYHKEKISTYWCIVFPVALITSPILISFTGAEAPPALSRIRRRSTRSSTVNLDTILVDLQFYHQYALVPTTLKTYTTAINRYSSFCWAILTKPFPTHECIMQLYATQLARRVSYLRIKVHLTGIQYYSTIQGHNAIIADTNLLYYTMPGIRRTQRQS